VTKTVARVDTRFAPRKAHEPLAAADDKFIAQTGSALQSIPG
jgi:hypothetical protein